VHFLDGDVGVDALEDLDDEIAALVVSTTMRSAW